MVIEDLERSVRAMRELHERLGDSRIRTLSPARSAGALPAGASATAPSSPPSSAMQTQPSDLRSSDASVAPRGPGTAGGEGASENSFRVWK